MKQGRLSLKPSIGFGTVNFLGHTLNSNFIGPLQEAIGRILEMPRPITKKQVRSLLGLINFYRRYIPDCTTLISPLTDLTRSRAPNRVEWGTRRKQLSRRWRKSKESILKLPDLDKEIILQTDASDVGIGACLLQQHEGVKHPVLYASKKLIERERNYPVGEREALVILWAVQKTHWFLYGQHFVLETDHRPLQYLYSAHSKSPRLVRWT